MMCRFRAALVMTAAFALLALGCEKPDTFEQFVKSKDSVKGVYSFDMNLDDTVGTYDISFFTRIDALAGAAEPGCLRLDVSWRSPSGKSAGETVYMDVSELLEEYRSGVTPRECGKWRIDVHVPNPPDGFRGLGIILEHNGTR